MIFYLLTKQQFVCFFHVCSIDLDTNYIYGKKKIAVNFVMTPWRLKRMDLKWAYSPVYSDTAEMEAHLEVFTYWI